MTCLFDLYNHYHKVGTVLCPISFNITFVKLTYAVDMWLHFVCFCFAVRYSIALIYYSFFFLSSLLFVYGRLNCFHFLAITSYAVQFSSVTQSCPTLCNSMDCCTPGFPVHHQLLELAQTHVHQVSDAIQSSHPLSSPSPPIFNLSQHQGLFK